MTELSASGINPPVFSKKQKTALFPMGFPSAFFRAVSTRTTEWPLSQFNCAALLKGFHAWSANKHRLAHSSEAAITYSTSSLILLFPPSCG